jgi:hypothetical protein
MDPMRLMRITDALMRALLRLIAIVGVLIAWAAGQLVHLVLALFVVFAIHSGARALLRLGKS